MERETIWQRILIGGIIFVILGVMFYPTEGDYFLNTNGDGDTLYVGGTGPNNYTKIQDAIDNASDGDTVIVYGGSYGEIVRINKRVSVIGRENNDGQIPTIVPKIDDYPQYMIYFARPNGAFLSGFEVNGYSKAYYGIWVKGKNNTISNTVVTNCEIGISIQYSNSNIIEKNIIRNNNFLSLEISSYSTDNSITKNIFGNNNRGLFIDSGKNTLSDNVFFRDGICIESSTVQILTNNTVDGKPIRYYKDKTDFITPTDTGEVILENCTNVTISSVSFTNTSFGICAHRCSDLNVYNNKFVDINTGIRIYSSGSSIIQENSFENSSWSAMEIYYIPNSTITGNKITQARFQGIDALSDYVTIQHNIIDSVSNCGVRVNGINNKITYNSISHCQDGILLGYGDCKNCTVSYNTIYSNSRYGIRLTGDYRFNQESNIILGNIIHNNKDSGIHISIAKNTSIYYNLIWNNNVGMEIFDAYGNTVSRNNFVRNNFSSEFDIYRTNMNPNSWHRNYWSDWHSFKKKPIYGKINGNETIIYDDAPRLFPFFLPYILPHLPFADIFMALLIHIPLKSSIPEVVIVQNN